MDTNGHEWTQLDIIGHNWTQLDTIGQYRVFLTKL
jgi:hypothetical protein